MDVDLETERGPGPGPGPGTDTGAAAAITRGMASLLLGRCAGRAACRKADVAKILEVAPSAVSSARPAVAKLLDEVYGFKLVELPKQFMLVLKDDRPDLERPEDELRPVLIAALTHIFMNGGSVKEDLLWQFLDEAGLVDIGDVSLRKTVMNRFTKEMYLEYVAVGDKESGRHNFEWGLRAHEELSKQYLLKKVAESFNRPVDYWTEQYKDAFPVQDQDR